MLSKNTHISPNLDWCMDWECLFLNTNDNASLQAGRAEMNLIGNSLTKWGQKSSLRNRYLPRAKTNPAEGSFSGVRSWPCPSICNNKPGTEAESQCTTYIDGSQAPAAGSGGREQEGHRRAKGLFCLQDREDSGKWPRKGGGSFCRAETLKGPGSTMRWIFLLRN